MATTRFQMIYQRPLEFYAVSALFQPCNGGELILNGLSTSCFQINIRIKIVYREKVLYNSDTKENQRY